MKFFIELSGRRYEVESVEGHPDRLTLNGRQVQVDSRKLDSAGGLSLLIDGRPVDVVVKPSGDGLTVHVDGRSFDAAVWDERAETVRRMMGSRGEKSSGSGEIRAPMPGLVVKLHVGEGEEVPKGARLIAVEAMKMENEITAPQAGRVKRILVQPGKAVEKGEVLMVVEGG